MFCKNCGYDLNDDAYVCPSCGEEVDKTQPEPKQEEEPKQPIKEDTPLNNQFIQTEPNGESLQQDTATKPKKKVNATAIIGFCFVMTAFILELISFLLADSLVKINVNLLASISLTPLFFSVVGFILGIVSLMLVKKYKLKGLTLGFGIASIVLAIISFLLGYALFLVLVLIGALNNANF